jgi:hypothetical protein
MQEETPSLELTMQTFLDALGIFDLWTRRLSRLYRSTRFQEAVPQ